MAFNFLSNLLNESDQFSQNEDDSGDFYREIDWEDELIKNQTPPPSKNEWTKNEVISEEEGGGGSSCFTKNL